MKLQQPGIGVDLRLGQRDAGPLDWALAIVFEHALGVGFDRVGGTADLVMARAGCC
jgi:hypothetical protein